MHVQHRIRFCVQVRDVQGVDACFTGYGLPKTQAKGPKAKSIQPMSDGRKTLKLHATPPPPQISGFEVGSMPGSQHGTCAYRRTSMVVTSTTPWGSCFLVVGRYGFAIWRFLLVWCRDRRVQGLKFLHSSSAMYLSQLVGRRRLWFTPWGSI